MEVEESEEVQRIVDELWSAGYYVDFSPIMLTVEEAKRFRPIYLDMVQDAVIVYDENGFMAKILSELAKKLEALGAERVWVGKRWY